MIAYASEDLINALRASLLGKVDGVAWSLDFGRPEIMQAVLARLWGQEAEMLRLQVTMIEIQRLASAPSVGP